MEESKEKELSLSEIVEQLKEAASSDVTREKIAQIKSNFYKYKSSIYHCYK